jgi:hypothetical protein
MHFRAVLLPTTGGKTEQGIFTHIDRAREWGHLMLQANYRKLKRKQWDEMDPGTRPRVVIYVTEESLLETVGPKEKKEEQESGE